MRLTMDAQDTNLLAAAVEPQLSPTLSPIQLEATAQPQHSTTAPTVVRAHAITYPSPPRTSRKSAIHSCLIRAQFLDSACVSPGTAAQGNTILIPAVSYGTKLWSNKKTRLRQSQPGQEGQG